MNDWERQFRSALLDKGYDAEFVDHDPAAGWTIYLGGNLTIEARTTVGVREKIAALPSRLPA